MKENQQSKLENRKDKKKFFSHLLDKFHSWNLKTEIKVAFIGFIGVVGAAIATGLFVLIAAFVPIIFGSKSQADIKPEVVQKMEPNDSPGSKNIQAAGNYIRTQTIYQSYKNESSSPTFDEIDVLEKRAMFNQEGGDRRSYARLLHLEKTLEDPIKKDLVRTAIERVENSYVPDILILNILDKRIFRVICKPHAVPDCSNGMEDSTGFSATNVLNHLSPRRRWDERIRAACLLRNIRTAPDKNDVNKETLYETLVAHMREDKENVLGVSKMVLETYKKLTGFTSEGIFDFDGAIKDWQQRKEEVLKIDF